MTGRRSFLGSLLALTAAPLASATVEGADKDETGAQIEGCLEPFIFSATPKQQREIDSYALDVPTEARHGYGRGGGARVYTLCRLPRGHAGRHANTDGVEWPCGVATRTVSCRLQVDHDGQHFGCVVGLSKTGVETMVRELYWS